MGAVPWLPLTQGRESEAYSSVRGSPWRGGTPTLWRRCHEGDQEPWTCSERRVQPMATADCTGGLLSTYCAPVLSSWPPSCAVPLWPLSPPGRCPRGWDGFLTCLAPSPISAIPLPARTFQITQPAASLPAQNLRAFWVRLGPAWLIACSRQCQGWPAG